MPHTLIRLSASNRMMPIAHSLLLWRFVYSGSCVRWYAFLFRSLYVFRFTAVPDNSPDTCLHTVVQAIVPRSLQSTYAYFCLTYLFLLLISVFITQTTKCSFCVFIKHINFYVGTPIPSTVHITSGSPNNYHMTSYIFKRICQF